MTRWREETKTVSPKTSRSGTPWRGELRRLVDVLEVERVALGDEVVQLADEPLGHPDLRLVGGGDDDLAAAQAELDPEPPLHELQVLVVRAAEGAHLVVVRELEPCRVEGFRRALTQVASVAGVPPPHRR